MTTIIIAIITTIFGTGGVLGYYFERRKRMAEAESKEINNGQQVVNLYKNALDDLAIRYEKKFEEISSLYERKIKVLEDEIKVHKRYVSTLKKETADLRRQIKILENGR